MNYAIFCRENNDFNQNKGITRWVRGNFTEFCSNHKYFGLYVRIAENTLFYVVHVRRYNENTAY